MLCNSTRKSVSLLAVFAVGVALLAGGPGAPASAEEGAGSEYDAALAGIRGAIGVGDVAYKFDATHQIPAAYSDGTRKTLNQDAELYVLNNASHASKATSQIHVGLLNDTHTGVEDSRCENSGFVASNATEQTAEIYRPHEAWVKLKRPLIAFNANYFDVMPQTDKRGTATKWGTSNCSSPQGVYYDNHPGTATQNEKRRYQPGTPYWIDSEGGNPQTTDTFFIVDGNKNGRDFDSFELVKNADGTGASAAENRAAELDGLNEYFSAFSGTSLYPTQGADVEAQAKGPDSGGSATTRIALAYDKGNDRLYVFRGGSYRHGVDRADLTAIVTALGASQAIELDGGGSAAVVADKSAFTWKGALSAPPPGACASAKDAAVCSPITQPDGTPRPVPGWVGLTR